MARHLMIESRGPTAGPGCARFLRDAAVLARSGHRVDVVLIQAGVIAAIPGVVPEVENAVTAGVCVWVDSYSSEQWGYERADMMEVRMVDMNDVAAALVEDDVRTVWR